MRGRAGRHDAIQNQASTVSQSVGPPSGERRARESDLALPFPRDEIVVVVAGIRLVTVGAEQVLGAAAAAAAG